MVPCGRRARIYAFIPALFAITLLFGRVLPECACFAQTAIPTDVANALRASATALSPVTISWRAQLSSDLPVQEWLKNVGMEPYEVDEFSPVEVVYCWQDGMSYVQSKQDKADITNVVSLEPDGAIRGRPGASFNDLPRTLYDQEVSCNLTNVFFGQGREGAKLGLTDPTLAIDPIDAPKFFKKDQIIFEPTYFYEAGFVLPDKVGTQGDVARSLPLRLLEEGGSVRKVEHGSHGGDECIVLEITKDGGTIRFFLDGARGYAVVRREEATRLGSLAKVVEADEFVKFDSPTIWLPRRCKVAYYTWWTKPSEIAARPIASREFAVSAVDKEPIPVERFSLRYTVPHTYVADSTLPGAKRMEDGILRYQVPAEVSNLDAAIEAAARHNAPAPRSPIGPAGRRLLMINCALVALVLVVFAVRRWRRGG